MLVPSLLPSDPAEGVLERHWNQKGIVKKQLELARHYHFEFLPLGFFSVIMARVLHTGWRLVLLFFLLFFVFSYFVFRLKECWLNGMLLTFEGHVSLLDLQEACFTLRVHVRGPQCQEFLLTLISCVGLFFSFDKSFPQI